MRYRFIRDHQRQFRVAVMCRVLDVSRSGYYDWLKAPADKGAEEKRLLEDEVTQVFEQSRQSYGSRRVRTALAKRGLLASRRRVRKIMKKLGLHPRRTRRFKSTTDSRHPFPVHPNLLAREFTVSSPNRVWASDITYVATDEGWLYLGTVIDLFSRRVVGWSMSDSLKSKLATDALEMAIGSRQPEQGLIHHSDRGVQYACESYQSLLRNSCMRCSMSRKGDCWDNAVVESFFSTLKKELIYRTRFASRDQARAAIFEFIEVFYNRIRMHSTLDDMSPAEFEAKKAA